MRLNARRQPIRLGLAILLGSALAVPLGTASAGAGTRTIVLVRHGQYREGVPADPEIGPGLTELGREQGRKTAARIAGSKTKIDAMYASPMARARETAAIIAQALGIEPEIVPDLAECTPPTIRADITVRHTKGEMDSCRTALDRDFERFFRPTAGPDSTVLLVCHGNVIRYLAGRTIGLGPTLWLNLSIAHASLTTVQVKSGGMQLISLGDSGHLPPDLVTFANPSRPDSSAARK